MHKVSVNKITYGRRDFLKGTKISEKEIPAKILLELEKAKKVEKVDKK